MSRPFEPADDRASVDGRAVDGSRTRRARRRRGGRRRRAGRRGGPAARTRLTEFIGQPRVRDQLGARARGAPSAGADRRTTSCCPGPPGLGKTSLALIIGRRAGRPSVKITSGPAIERAGDLAAMLSYLARGRRALHRRDPPHRPAGRGDALPGDGGLPGRRHRRQGPGRDGDPAGDHPVHPRRRDHPRRPADRRRCATGSASSATWSSTTPAELQQVLRRSAGLLGVDADRATAPPRSPAGPGARRASPTGCCAGCATTPRSRPTAGSTREVAQRGAARSTTSTTLGLDRLDRAVLEALCRRFGGGPVGLSTLAVAVGEEPTPSRRSAEPFLVRAGLLARTPRGARSRPRPPGGTSGSPAAAGGAAARDRPARRSTESLDVSCGATRRTGGPGCVVRAAVGA